VQCQLRGSNIVELNYSKIYFTYFIHILCLQKYAQFGAGFITHGVFPNYSLSKIGFFLYLSDAQKVLPRSPQKITRSMSFFFTSKPEIFFLKHKHT
jgi:hypothetical protein